MEPKLQTFLTLCEVMNYHEAAERLHLSQPAITKQMQALEAEYGCKLLAYNGRRLTMTPEGRLLQEYAEAYAVNEQELLGRLAGATKPRLKLGATRTIGDYVIGSSVAAYYAQHGGEMEVVIDNTRNLLTRLEQSELDMILVEGIFDKMRYDAELIRREAFCGFCHREHPFANRTVGMAEFLGQTLIVREEGSGTRRFLEAELAKNGFQISAFCDRICVNSFVLLKQLVKQKVGVSYGYEAVIAGDAALAPFYVEGFFPSHEFNAVFLKHTKRKPHLLQFLEILQSKKGRDDAVFD